MLGRLWHRLQLLAYTWRKIGAWGLLRVSLRWTADREARRLDTGFDELHGTDTASDLTPREAAIPAARRRDATMYLPTHDGDVEAMLGALAWPDALLRQTTFVDIGSGKGRVVLIAAMRRFREVVGVELSPILHAIAGHNVARLEAAGALASPVRLLHQDAADLDVPAGPVVAYLYHPFHEAIATGVIDRLVASIEADPRPVAIVYAHPTVQPALGGHVFRRGDVFDLDAEGGRQTKRFHMGWTIWTNRGWLERRALDERSAA